MSIFQKDFYPTPEHVIAEMVDCESVAGKTVLEPSAGKGDIVKYLQMYGADVIACEKEPQLKKLVSSYCLVIADDFLSVTADMVSHIDYIFMNPPFSADEHHILHAFDIAPAGCRIISLCNLNCLEHNWNRRCNNRLRQIINENGEYVKLGNCFSDAERQTDVEVALIRLQKPAQDKEESFEGFFMEDDPEEQQQIGLIPHNHIRELVQRYKAAVLLFDTQLETAVKMNSLIETFTNSNITMQVKDNEVNVQRNDFVKKLQKAAWKHVFNKLNMEKFTTKGLREDINKFVERQQTIPFTMRNIYRMVDIVIGTHEQRMDRAVIEVFERLTSHYHENRYNVEGWKTNSHYLMGQKFIMPYSCEPSYRRGVNFKHYMGSGEQIQDLIKAMCWLTGEPYNETYSKPKEGYDDLTPNKWYDWGFFEFKVFKKGTAHFKFKNIDQWAMLNQRIAKIKGYPLFEHV